MHKRNKENCFGILIAVIFLSFFLYACQANNVKITFILKKGNTNNSSIVSSKENTEEVMSIPILVYHHLLPDKENFFGNNAFIVSTDNFEKQMQLLKENNYNTISLNQLKAYLKGETTLTGKNVLITFDDGYKSTFVYAYPIMKKYLLHGVIFVVSGWIQNNRAPFNPKMLQILDWADIEASMDVFEYASHTHNLHWKNGNNESLLISSPEETVYDDFLKSKEMLKTGSIAYPYGEYSEATLLVLRKLEYEMGFTINEGDVKPGDDIYRLKRHVIYRDTSLEEFKKIIGLK
ncbi:MAG: polysaccharide deacetylase family protein [Firmicutes bacterium]|nr:polysaccharide deacetylase family protein [Bacillota bacterium]